MTVQALTTAELEPFRRLTTCVVSSAIELFRVRLPNTGFTNSGIRCIYRAKGPVIGYAATARIRASDPPMTGTPSDYYDRKEWWSAILKVPAPRIVVIQDVDHPPGVGAFLGEVHANILIALGCVGVVTNGAVRDLPSLEPMDFQVFAGSIGVSHAYAHVFDFGGEVEVAGLKFRPGDLVHGDCHGCQTVPLEIAHAVAGAAEAVKHRREVIDGVCHGKDFNLDTLRNAIRSSVVPRKEHG